MKDELKKLFDYQSIEKNDELESVIDDTHSRFPSNIEKLSDESIELVTAGVGARSARNKEDAGNKTGSSFIKPRNNVPI